jgi:uncharacterized membrane protein YfcA
MLILVFQVPAPVAISSDVVAATLMKVVGGLKHWQQKTLDPQVVLWLALGSVPGALTGVGLFHWFQQDGNSAWSELSLKLMGGLILVVALVGALRLIGTILFPEFQGPNFPRLDLQTWSGRAVAMLIGMVLGGLVGLTSIASGSMFAMVLMACFQLDARKLVGTDISQSAILLSFTSLGHLSLGAVDWGIVGAIWLGSVPGVLLGAKLCQAIPPRPLQALVYSVLLFVSWKLVI